MRDFLCDAWNNQTVRYIVSALVGYFLAVAANLATSLRTESKLRRATREVLVEEVSENLYILDVFDDVLARALNDPPGVLRLPVSRLKHSILNRCLDGAISAVLTEGEQIQLATAYSHALEFNAAIEELQEGSRRGQVDRNSELQKLRVHYLPYVGQTMMDLLCQCLENHGRFAYTRSAEMVKKMQPVITANRLDVDRAWRTSDMGRVTMRPTDMLLAWKNDDPAKVPEGVQVIVIRPESERGHWTADLRSTTRWGRMTNRLGKWRQRRRLLRAIRDQSVVARNHDAAAPTKG